MQHYLNQLLENEKFWQFKIKHSVWVDNGKGGCVDKDLELEKCRAQIIAVRKCMTLV